jgi:hypothetical protein
VVTERRAAKGVIARHVTDTAWRAHSTRDNIARKEERLNGWRWSLGKNEQRYPVADRKLLGKAFLANPWFI